MSGGARAAAAAARRPRARATTSFAVSARARAVPSAAERTLRRPRRRPPAAPAPERHPRASARGAAAENRRAAGRTFQQDVYGPTRRVRSRTDAARRARHDLAGGGRARAMAAPPTRLCAATTAERPEGMPPPYGQSRLRFRRASQGQWRLLRHVDHDQPRAATSAPQPPSPFGATCSRAPPPRGSARRLAARWRRRRPARRPPSASRAARAHARPRDATHGDLIRRLLHWAVQPRRARPRPRRRHVPRHLPGRGLRAVHDGRHLRAPAR